MINYPQEISYAIQLYRDGKQQESHDCLHDFLIQRSASIYALLWLAKVSPGPDEAVTDAELALKLDPANEVAQRAAIAVGPGTVISELLQYFPEGTSTWMYLFFVLT